AVQTINVGVEPTGVAVSPINGNVYVANGGGTVSVINPATNAVQTITISNSSIGPAAVAINPTGPQAGDVYVAYGPGLMTARSPTPTAIRPTTTSTPDNSSGAWAGMAVVPNGTVSAAAPEELWVMTPATYATNVVNLPGEFGLGYGVAVGGVAVSPTGPQTGDI